MKLKFKFRNGELLSPARVDHNVYDPNLTSAESLDVLNGHLDHSNLDFLADQPLPLSALRRGSLFRGKMVGSTLNVDYHKKLFNYRDSGDWHGQEDSDVEMIQPIPGAGIEFYAPTSGTILLTWQVSYSSDLDRAVDGESSDQTSSNPEDIYKMVPTVTGDYGLFGAGQDSKIRASRAFLTLMGATNDDSNLSEVGYRQYFPWGINGYDPAIDPQRIMGHGRIWSGHYMVEATEQTWYRYAIGLLSTANMARVRVRNFKYLFFPNASATLT